MNISPSTDYQTGSDLVAWSEFLQTQRWFGGKGKKILRIEVVVSLPWKGGAEWQILEITYEDQTHEWYQVPQVGDCDALADRNFRKQLFELLVSKEVLESDDSISIRKLTTPPRWESSQLLALEQSNSSILYGDTSFLKFFRKLESGINPELEILTHLNELNDVVRVPTLYSTLQITIAGKTCALAVLLQMVTNQGNAWEMALRYVRERKSFAEAAAVLGKRTAELHLALGARGKDFGIRDSSPEEGCQLLETFQTERNQIRNLLEEKIPFLTGKSAQMAKAFLEEKKTWNQLFDSISKITFPTIRIHGDYHLGQVLITGDDFMIIDFEGEPARSLAERRKHQSPLVDVAGMLRSFHYAGCQSNDSTWQKNATSIFLQSYFEAMDGSPVLLDAQTTQTMLEFFLWKKKLYEIRYELNNRPDWLWIPLQEC